MGDAYLFVYYCTSGITFFIVHIYCITLPANVEIAFLPSSGIMYVLCPCADKISVPFVHPRTML